MFKLDFPCPFTSNYIWGTCIALTDCFFLSSDFGNPKFPTKVGQGYLDRKNRSAYLDPIINTMAEKWNSLVKTP